MHTLSKNRYPHRKIDNNKYEQGLFMPVLERIFGTRSKVRIVRELMRDLERDLSLEDIVKATKMSYGTIHPAISELANARIVLVRKAGSSKLYKINSAHVLFPELASLMDREMSAFRGIAYEIADNIEKKGIVNIILFGSVARSEITEAGDIDFLIIYKDSKVINKTDALEDEILDKYDVLFSPIYISKVDVLRRIKEFDDFILRIMDEGEIIYGDAKWLVQ